MSRAARGLWALYLVIGAQADAGRWDRIPQLWIAVLHELYERVHHADLPAVYAALDTAAGIDFLDYVDVGCHDIDDVLDLIYLAYDQLERS